MAQFVFVVQQIYDFTERLVILLQLYFEWAYFLKRSALSDRVRKEKTDLTLDESKWLRDGQDDILAILTCPSLFPPLDLYTVSVILFDQYC